MQFGFGLQDRYRFTEDQPCMWVCCTLNGRTESNVLSLVWCLQSTSTDSPIGFRDQGDGRGKAGVVWKFREAMPAQVSSSSSDHSSKV
ncbi:hypothetical protein AVEN_212330-1 [Araneus ventricosus]|uniref:Uncharacterized protein n=1 Tax=Araneus ventricosus TaxID=182803 RepID=A0A4Y2F3H9_ARAVE|nr:hypothetical protein AVEN_212330-1 [Araneus ventricosus]